MRAHSLSRLTPLLALGLRESAAKVYLALLQQPAMSAAALAKSADVPRSHLYKVVEELQSMGLAEILLEASRRTFRARPLVEHLRHRELELAQELETMRVALETIGPEFEPPPLGSHGETSPASVRILLGRRAVAREIDLLLAEAKRDVVLASSPQAWGRLARHLARWRSGTGASGVSLTVHIPAGVEPPGDDLRAEVLRLDAAPTTFSLVLDRAMLLSVTPVPDDGDDHRGADFGLVCGDVSLARSHVGLLRAASRVA